MTSRLHEDMGTLALRGARGDEAISFSGKDCFAPLAMTSAAWRGNREVSLFTVLSRNKGEAFRWTIIHSHLK